MQNQEESGSAVNNDSNSNYSEEGGVEQVDSHRLSTDSIGQYQTYSGFINNLEESISLIEMSAIKFLPIYLEL
jgi:hypothetical protein